MSAVPTSAGTINDTSMQSGSAFRPDSRLALVCLVAVSVILFAVLTLHWWAVDDAYITLRTVDNAVNGYGLRWNAAERVQAFTHPLWALLLLVPYFFTREAFFTSLVFTLALSAGTIWIVGFRLSKDRLAAAAAIVLMLSSRAFVDFSSSNLENPLSHVLIALFALAYLRRDRRALTWLFLIGGLLALSRMDLALLVGPALAVRWWQARRPVRPILAAAIPNLAWTTFAVIYYGFPFPNTAYAKLNTGIPGGELAVQGACYLLESLFRDPITLVTCAVAVVVGFVGASRRQNWPLAAGIVLYLVYVVRIGGDFMSGRFCAAPFLFAVVLLVSPGVPAFGRSVRVRLAALACLGLVAFGSLWVVHPNTRLDFLRRYVGTDPKFRTTFRFIFPPSGEATGLVAVLTNPSRQIEHPWAAMGRALRARGPRVLNWGGIGLVGYYGGPNLYIVDPPALGDPLLARLPAKLPWFPGHFDRRLPEGYTESLETGTNVVTDPNVRAYYEKLRIVTRGPIWTWERFRTILSLNLGYDDVLLSDYGRLTARAQKQGTAWTFESPEGVAVWERGVRLRLEPSCSARRLEIRATGKSIYKLRFLAAGRVLAEQRVAVADETEPAYEKLALSKNSSFDTVELTLVHGTHPATLKLLRFAY